MTTKICAFDIETIARPNMSDNIINSFVKVGNLKDPAKIAAKKADARLGLGKNPLTAIPCCGGWYSSESDCGYVLLENESIEAEKTFLIEYLTKLSEFDILVGFNSISFDSKILLLRAAVHGIQLPFELDRKRYSTSGNHLDIRMVLCDWNNFEQGTLSFFLDMFNMSGKIDGMDGSMVQPYWSTGRHEEIGEYCVQDCRATLALHQKLKGYFF